MLLLLLLLLLRLLLMLLLLAVVVSLSAGGPSCRGGQSPKWQCVIIFAGWVGFGFQMAFLMQCMALEVPDVC